MHAQSGQVQAVGRLQHLAAHARKRFEGDPRRFVSIGLAGGMQGGLVDWHSGEITSPNLASGIACGQTWSPDNGSYPFAWPFISPADYEWVEPDCDHETDLPVAQATCMHVPRTGRLDQRWREGCVDGGHGSLVPAMGA